MTNEFKDVDIKQPYILLFQYYQYKTLIQIKLK